MSNEPKPLKDLPRGEQIKIFEAWLDGRLELEMGAHEHHIMNPDGGHISTGGIYRIRPKRVSVDAELLARLVDVVGMHQRASIEIEAALRDVCASAEELP